MRNGVGEFTTAIVMVVKKKNYVMLTQKVLDMKYKESYLLSSLYTFAENMWQAHLDVDWWGMNGRFPWEARSSMQLGNNLELLTSF